MRIAFTECDGSIRGGSHRVKILFIDLVRWYTYFGGDSMLKLAICDDEKTQREEIVGIIVEALRLKTNSIKYLNLIMEKI